MLAACDKALTAAKIAATALRRDCRFMYPDGEFDPDICMSSVSGIYIIADQSQKLAARMALPMLIHCKQVLIGVDSAAGSGNN
jgi:hypothetical protein